MLGLHVPGSRFKAALAALSRSLGLIEFTLDGRVLTANENFCELIGYSLSEIKGKHHSLFVDPAYAASPDYKTFWLKLGRGEYDAGQYKRITKDGREIWIQASYNPVRGRRGTISKIIKQVTDITAEKLASAEFASISNAISRAQATIEFTPTGEVITANDHFLKVMGYQLEEIKGQSHRLFVDADYSSSQAYRDFWKKLAAGDYVAAEFKRISKDGREVWLQASYNPIFDINNKVAKVIKFATDVTDRVKAVNGVAAALQELAANNLMYRIIDQYPPEFEAVRLDFNLSLEKLEETMNSITSSTQSVQDGASEITQASDDLSKRTEQQAANLEETAAAMDQITSTVRKSAQNAQEALNVVRVAHAEAERSGAVVRETVSAMSSIDHSSKQIGNIIGVIDEIAFQTNLLALNAGVEAARAGDAGRGFAVVATEVRALAQRSADAAKEIKTLISESSRQVDTGVTLVAETGRALVSIAAQVTRLTGLIGDMASSGLEQATGLSHVNTSVNQLDQVTQQSAAMVEQATAASHSLEREAQELTRLIGQFRITRPSNSDLVDFRLDRAGSANGTQSRRIVGVRDPRASPL